MELKNNINRLELVEQQLRNKELSFRELEGLRNVIIQVKEELEVLDEEVRW